ncbi:MAG: hypothetical protein ACJ8EB_04025 [Allosphingosinicella sp.]
MARLLSLLMIFALVTSQGTAMASALCRHGSAEGHAVALNSADAKVASVAIGEEAAAAGAAKKAQQSADGSVHWPAQLLPAEADAPPARVAERLRFHPGRHAALASASIPPLQKPPST